MITYEVYVGTQWRGTVEADTQAEARQAAREGGLWRRGEGRSTVLQRVSKKTGRTTARTAMDRTKTGELGSFGKVT